MNAEIRATALAGATAAMLLVATSASAQTAPAPKSGKAVQTAPPSGSTKGSPAAVANQNTYEEMYLRYLTAANATPPPSTSWMADLTTDVRARHVNDLVTIRIIESLAATGSADANLTKTTKVDATFPSPISHGISKIAPSEVDTKFAGAGASSRTSTMTAMLTARVTQVLPNGDLVVEGVRQIEVNADRQVVVLTGVIRQADLGLDNTASSAVVGQLRIQCIGQGLVKDGMTPGWLIRVLNKVF